MQPAPSTPTVSLFPFLTVLLATMGILVVMLVLVVKSTSLTSAEVADDRREEQAQQLLELQDAIELEQLRRDGLLAIRPDLIEQLHAARLTRATVQTALDELAGEAEAIARQLEALTADAPIDSPERLAARRAELQAQIETLQSQLDLRREVQGTEPQRLYSIVPTSQVDGAVRQPIYIECVSAGLILQPYGIVIAVHDMPVPGLPGNPLDAALSVIREYDRRYGNPAQTARPYPLLVVRPSGSAMYGLARRAMSGWADEFGYELVEQDLPLDFGAPDPLLAEVVERAVERAKREQVAHARMLQEMARRQSAARESPRGAVGEGLQADVANGGFIRTDGRDGPPRPARVNQSLASTADAQPADDAQAMTTSTPPAGDQQRAPNDRGERAASNPTSTPTHAGTGGPSSQPSGAQESLARTRGQNWALGGMAQGVPYCRPVRVVCTSTRLTIVPGRLAVTEPKAIDFADDVRDAVDPLVDGVAQLVQSWGPPPPDGHWRPELRLSFSPSSRSVAERLTALLQESGYDLVGESR